MSSASVSSGQAPPGMSAFDGLRVVEVTRGVTDLGLGAAGGVPGMLFAQLGAQVTRVLDTVVPEIDQHHDWGRVWHRHKTIVRTDDPVEVRELVAGADVALLYGPERLVEGQALTYDSLAPQNPSLVLVRCAPSTVGGSAVDDFGLLVDARSGFCTQLAGHREGPIFADVRATGSGAAFLVMTSALALLHQREITGRGGCADTSLYDGMLSTLGCMIGRSEHAPPDVEGYWREGSTFPNFLYRCADDELVQVWFGGKGMYPKLIEVLGDEPSEQGYYADQVSGNLQARAKRWASLFRARPRDEWIQSLRAEGVACEPVNGPGQALSDPHVVATGLSVSDGGDLMLGSPIAVEALSPGAEPADGEPADIASGAADAGSVDAGPADQGPAGSAAATRALQPLAGLRVADFSAFVAGPLAAQVLADLGADVVKIEPPAGEAMRAAAYAVAACQRGKRSVALDIGSEQAVPAVEALLGWADVVLHNFRVGVSERLGIGHDKVATLRSDAVYCHASGFGPDGPRAKLPANDALMQALTGYEVAIGGEGNDPIAGTWIPIDMAGGWLAAIGILTGLVERARGGGGQLVNTSLLGAGLLLHSGVYQRDSEVVEGPHVDADQCGYGPGYRIHETADGSWLALVIPDSQAWKATADVLGIDLPDYTPLRTGPDDAAARQAEKLIAGAIATKPAGEWLAPLRAAGALVEPVRTMNRDEFRQGILDDPANRSDGRVADYSTPEWGAFQQIGPLLRLGPDEWSGPTLNLPGVGEHTEEVLAMVGVDPQLVSRMVESGVAVQAGK